MSRPYFETKVVKVKEKEKEWTPDCCPCCGAKREAEKPLGNWVNGENLDKIKFPCFCSYRYESKTHYGIITRTRLNLDRDHYTLHSIEKQHGSYSSVHSYITLKYMIKYFDIHILKGKIIIYEEEKV